MATEDNTFLTADNLYEEVDGEAGKSLTLEDNQKQNLVGTIQSRFYQAEDARRADETRWLKAYENYRGLYSDSVKFRDSENLVSLLRLLKQKYLLLLVS